MFLIRMPEIEYNVLLSRRNIWRKGDGRESGRKWLRAE